MSAFDLVHVVRETIVRHGLLAPGQTVVVAVSGGPDSVSLLHVLARLRQEWDWTLVAAHLDHGFRGAEAEADAAYVAKLCAALGVACRVERVDVPALRRRRHLSAQEAGRAARHRFLRRVAAECDAERIAVGHTRSDRVETVFLNLLRGAGPEGLGALPPAALPLVRPLIEVERAATVDYCAQCQLAPRNDSSNDRLDYRRNRLRTELLPYLVSYYNEKVDDAVLRMADLVSADNAYLDELAAGSLNQVIVAHSDTQVTLDGAGLNALQLALRRRVLRKAVEQVRGNLQGIGFEALERVIRTACEGGRRQFQLPGGDGVKVRIACDCRQICIARDDPPFSALPWQIAVEVPGRTALAPSGMVLEAVWRAGTDEARAKQDWADLLMQEGARGSTPLLLFFRAADVALPLVARSWRPGDRIRTRAGGKKLQDLFTDAGVPAAERPWIPVLVEAGGNGRILAVAGLQADAAALRPSDPGAGVAAGERLLALRFRRLSGLEMHP